MSGDRQKAIDVGCNDYHAKPVVFCNAADTDRQPDSESDDGRYSLSEVSPGSLHTEALLHFAGDLDAVLTSFDDADVNHRSLDQVQKDPAWWDAERSGLKLRKRMLSGASLRRADLTHADLAGADLTAIKGAGLNLTRACLEGTDLTDADLIGATLNAVSAGEADFSNALLEDADLHGAHLRFARFNDTIMDGAICPRPIFGVASSTRLLRSGQFYQEPAG